MNARSAARRTLAAVLGAALLPAAAAQAAAAAPEALDAVLQSLGARQHGHVSYQEVQQLRMLDRPLHSSGELLYQAPDHLEKRALKPRAETLIIDKDTLIARRGTRAWRVPLAEHPEMAPFAVSLRATLAGDRAALQRYFTLQFDGDVSAWTLLLTPRDARLAAKVRTIRIEGAQGTLHSVGITQADGDHSLLTLGPELEP